MDFQSQLTKYIENGGRPFRQNSISYIFTCPRCEKKEKLYIRKRDGRFVCWVCATTNNFTGKAEFALREIYGDSLSKIHTFLYGTVAPETLDELDIEFEDHWGEREALFELKPDPTGVLWPPDFYVLGDHEFGPGFHYLRSRGITIEHMRTYRLGYHPPTQRVIFPIWSGDRLMGWQGRYVLDNEIFNAITGEVRTIPKALTHLTEDVDGKILMFQERLETVNHCVLTEGPVDAIKAHLCGGNVAALGKGVSESQIRTIGSYVRKLYIALDSNAADDIARIVRDYFDDFEMFLMRTPPGRKDLGESDPEEVLEAFRTAEPLERDRIIISLGDRLVY